MVAIEECSCHGLVTIEECSFCDIHGGSPALWSNDVHTFERKLENDNEREVKHKETKGAVQTMEASRLSTKTCIGGDICLKSEINVDNVWTDDHGQCQDPQGSTGFGGMVDILRDNHGSELIKLSR
jgi:hypothetical protein